MVNGIGGNFTMSLSEVIKTAAIQAVSANSFIDFINGTIAKFDLDDIEEPILIRVNQKLILKKNYLIFTETAFNKLKKDDNFILARTNDGQKYIVIDKVIQL